MRPPRRPVAVRRRLLLAVATAMLAALLVVTVSFNVLLRRSLDGDATSLARARAVAALATLDVTTGQVAVTETPDNAVPDAQAWVFAGQREIETPPAAAAAAAAAARQMAAGARDAVSDPPATGVRLVAVPIATGARRIGTVVAQISLAPYTRSARIALVASTLLAVVAFLGALLAARWILRRALTPVTSMTRQAADWSARDLDRRFALGAPYDELSELAATLDRLLDRIAASVRREQRFSAEISHELRTPLARIVAEADLALRRDRDPDEYRDALTAMRRNADEMGRIVEALVAAARHEAATQTTACKVSAVLDTMLEPRRTQLPASAPQIVFTPVAPDIAAGIDRDLLERILAPILDNAARHARTRVDVHVDATAGIVDVTIADDGPGVGADEAERIFEPGVRGATARDGTGAGLGLALARRLARSAGGDVTVDPGPRGLFHVLLPAA